jgi:hypothetical protein
MIDVEVAHESECHGNPARVYRVVRDLNDIGHPKKNSSKE